MDVAVAAAAIRSRATRTSETVSTIYHSCMSFFPFSFSLPFSLHLSFSLRLMSQIEYIHVKKKGDQDEEERKTRNVITERGKKMRTRKNVFYRNNDDEIETDILDC